MPDFNRCHYFPFELLSVRGWHVLFDPFDGDLPPSPLSFEDLGRVPETDFTQEFKSRELDKVLICIPLNLPNSESFEVDEAMIRGHCLEVPVVDVGLSGAAFPKLLYRWLSQISTAIIILAAVIMI